MDNVITDTPTENTEPTSNQDIELLIDEEGIMDDTPTPDNEPKDIDKQTDDNQPSDESEPKDKSDNTNQDLTYDLDEELDKDFVIKVNGEEITASLKELKVLAQKGMDYQKKTMNLAKHKDLLGSLEQYGISSIDDLNNFINNSQGEELQALPKSEYSEDIEQVASEIMERDNADAFKEVVSGLPDKAFNEVKGDAKVLASLYVDFDSGLAQQLLPETRKIMTLRSDVGFVEAYNMAGDRIVGGNSNNKAKAIQQPRNSFVEEHSDVLSDDEFNEITARLSGLQ